MACYTQQEIAYREEMPRKTVDEVLAKMADLQKPPKPAADHLTDFDVPLYNVWKRQAKTNSASHL